MKIITDKVITLIKVWFWGVVLGAALLVGYKALTTLEGDTTIKNEATINCPLNNSFTIIRTPGAQTITIACE